MPTLNEIVYDIKNIGYGGDQSDDVKVSDRQVAYWVGLYRSLLLEQLWEKRKSLPDIFVQHLECVQLECVDAVECCELNSDNQILRSTQKLPDSIQRNGKNGIIAVSSADKRVGFSETSFYRQRSDKYAKYTGGEHRWYIKNGYLYLTNNHMTEWVSVSGVFEDPTEATNFTTCDGALCFTWDDKYPMTNAMANKITSIILKERLGLTTQSPVDEANNANGEPQTNRNHERA